MYGNRRGHDDGNPYSKGAVNVRRDPLQRVRDDGVPTGGPGVEQRGMLSSLSRHASLSLRMLAYN